MNYNTGDTNSFKCGHTGVVPNNMGRGMARINRINAYFNRNCLDCALAAATSLHNSLTKSVKTLDERLREVKKRYT